MDPLVIKILVLVAGAAALVFVAYLVATILRESEQAFACVAIVLYCAPGPQVHVSE